MNQSQESKPRISPLEAPFAPEVAEELSRWQGSGGQPIALFRTLTRHLPLARAMFPLGHYFLTRQSSLPIRVREIVIDRVCARCGCEYEWGVHALIFAKAAGFDREQLRSLVVGDSNDACWTESDRLLINMVDALHDSSKISAELWSKMSTRWSSGQLFELLVLAGWYHAICFFANGLQVSLEPQGIRFPRE
jgi:alkylhydroperoxidase family enzyme